MQMCSNETRQADLDLLPAAGEQKLHEQQAVGHELGGDRKNIEMGVLASLVLGCRVAHGNQQSLEVATSTSEDLVQGLVRKSVTKFKENETVRIWYEARVWKRMQKACCVKVCRALKNHPSEIAKRLHPSHPLKQSHQAHTTNWPSLRYANDGPAGVQG